MNPPEKYVINISSSFTSHKQNMLPGIPKLLNAGVCVCVCDDLIDQRNEQGQANKN